jgi:4-aminobutyrate aminotransferase-like enzyme
MAYDARFRIQPAMTIDERTIDEAVGVIDEVFGELKRTDGWKKS